MIEIKKIEPERCPECGKVHPRTFLVRLSVFEIILCKDCLTNLRNACGFWTRWP